MPTGQPRSPGEKRCAVCEAADATYNYKALTCKSCKSFFVRCADRFSPHECKKNGNCPIVPHSTVNCKGCRYRRCVALGMHVEDVGRLYKKQEKENAVPKLENREQRVQRYVGPTLSLGCNFVQQATNNLGPKWFAGFFSNLARLVLTKDCFGPQLKYFNIKISLADAFANSRACFSKDEELRVTEEEGLRLVIAQNYCRIIVSFTNFTTAIPELYYLSTPDKMKLIQNNCLPVYHLQFFCWLHYETDPVETLRHIKRGVNIVSKTHTARVKLAFDFYENSVAPFIAEEDVSLEEMSLLLIILVFTPFCDCSEQGKDIIRSARGKYVNILLEYQNVMYPTMTTRRKKDRIAKMLYFLTKEKECIGLIHQSFTASILNNDDFLMGTLTHDLHLRVYN